MSQFVLWNLQFCFDELQPFFCVFPSLKLFLWDTPPHPSTPEAFSIYIKTSNTVTETKKSLRNNTDWVSTPFTDSEQDWRTPAADKINRLHSWPQIEQDCWGENVLSQIWRGRLLQEIWSIRNLKRTTHMIYTLPHPSVSYSSATSWPFKPKPSHCICMFLSTPPVASGHQSHQLTVYTPLQLHLSAPPEHTGGFSRNFTIFSWKNLAVSRTLTKL